MDFVEINFQEQLPPTDVRVGLPYHTASACLEAEVQTLSLHDLITEV